LAVQSRHAVELNADVLSLRYTNGPNLLRRKIGSIKRNT
jgi:hypothetical protein